MADDDEVIRRRLLTRTSVVGKPPIKKCAEIMLSLLDSVSNDADDVQTTKHEMESLLWEIDQLEFEANKTDILSFTSQRELEAYEKLHAEIDASIDKVAQEIDHLKTKVHVEKTIRGYKEEYESISRVINELPSRKQLAQEIAVEEKRLEEAKESINSVDSKLDLRVKQFSVLMNTIQNLKRTLAEDDEEAKLQQADEDMEDASATPARSGRKGDDEDDDDLMDGLSPATP